MKKNNDVNLIDNNSNTIDLIKKDKNVSNMTKLMIISLLGIKEIKNDIDSIHSENNDILDVIDNSKLDNKEEHKETRRLITDSALEISNAIINGRNNLPDKYSNLCAEKIWMFARHPEFVIPFQILKDNRFITEKDNYYIWNKNDDGSTYTLSVLIYFIMQNLKLKETTAKHTRKTITDDVSIFTSYVWEPFNIAFRHDGFENNASKIKEKPSKYDEFIGFLNKDERLIEKLI